MNADGSNIVELTPPNANVCENDPSFTPDGSRIVFDRFDPDAADEAFWSMNRNGGDRQRIGLCCFDPNVSPNGKKLSFLAGQEGALALFTSDINGNNPFQVTPFSFDVAIKQDWAPDGQHLVFTQNGDVLVPGVSTNIATIHRDGTHLHFVNALRRRGRQRLCRFLLSRWSMDRVSPQRSWQLRAPQNPSRRHPSDDDSSPV
jgi:Tol biopolymer transport system component